MIATLISIVLVLQFGAPSCEGKVSSEGTHLLFSLPPISSQYTVDTEIRFTARNTTEVTLVSMYVHNTMVVSAGETGTFHLLDDFHVTNGLEEKAFELISDLPITVTIGTMNHTNNEGPDQILVRPLHENATEFYVISKTGDILGSNPPTNFYTIAAAFDDTDLSIYSPQTGDTLLVQLQRYETYTEEAGSANTDFTGVHITATKPVAVNSGNGKWFSGDNRQYACDSLPSVHDLGFTYLTFPVGFGLDTTGYEVRVLATKNDTELHSPGRPISTLQAGEYTDIIHGLSNAAFKFVCTLECIATQFVPESTARGGTLNLRMGSIMVPLVQETRFGQDFIFTTPYMGSSSVYALLSIVTDRYPVQNLFLNNQRLDDANWSVAAGNEFAYIMLDAVENTSYRLHTTDSDLTFSAYMYTTRDAGTSVSKGYAVGYSGGQYDPHAMDPHIETMYLEAVDAQGATIINS